MRVHVQISEPFELVPEGTPRGAAVQAEMDSEFLRLRAAEAEVVGQEGLTFDVARVSISSRHVGEGLDRLLRGLPVIVNGTLVTRDGRTIHFIGSAHDAARAVGPWPFK